MHCLAYPELLLSLNCINILESMCPRGAAAEGSPQGAKISWTDSSNNAVGSSPWALEPRLPPAPCACPHLRPVAVQGSREDLDPAFHVFPRNSSGGLPLHARQKSSAAPDTDRVDWSAARDSRATIQTLQLLWLNHLLNYTGKCAWNHDFHWFSSPCLKPK